MRAILPGRSFMLQRPFSSISAPVMPHKVAAYADAGSGEINTQADLSEDDPRDVCQHPRSDQASHHQLLVKHGFRGTNFRTIARRLKTTTTNIHYHFGNKSALVEEVVQDYVTDASRRQMLIWLDGFARSGKSSGAPHAQLPAVQEIQSRCAHEPSLESYRATRLEMDVLTPTAVAALASFTTDVRACVRAAVHAAAEKNELRSEAPLDKLAGLLGSVVDSASVLSQDAKSFKSLNQLFEIVEHLIYSAYGQRRAVRRRRPLQSGLAKVRLGSTALCFGRPVRVARRERKWHEDRDRLPFAPA